MKLGNGRNYRWFIDPPDLCFYPARLAGRLDGGRAMLGHRVLHSAALNGVFRRCNGACSSTWCGDCLSAWQKSDPGGTGCCFGGCTGGGSLSRRGAIKEDTAIGVLFAAALSIGVVLISSIRTYAVDLSHILFGNVLGVSSLDLWLTAGLGAVILISILVFYRPFLVISFDPVLATTLRMRVGFFNNLLLVLLALTIVISMQTVGVGLVAAMLVTPAATAFLLVRRLPTMMALAGLIGGFSSLTGFFASYHLNVASGAAIVLTATLLFLLAFLFAPQRGLVWDLSRRRSA